MGPNVLGTAVGTPVGASDGAMLGAVDGAILGAVVRANSIDIHGDIGLPSEGGGGSKGNVAFAAIAKLRKVVAKLSINSIEGGSFNPARISGGASMSSCKITPDPRF